MSKDNIYIYELLTNYFKARHFQQIPTDIAQVSMYATFHETSLYLINIITLESNYVFDRDMYNQYRETTKAQFGGVESERIYLLNVLIMDNPSLLYEVVNVSPDLNDHFVDIHWIVNSETKELVIPEKQLHSLLGLEGSIRDIVKTGMDRFNDMRKTSKHVFVTRSFVMVNVLIWFVLLLMGKGQFKHDWFSWTISIHDYVVSLQATGGLWWYMMSIFVHASLAHLVFVTLSLYIFGSKLERYLSGFQYVFIYLFSAAMGALFSYLGSLATGSDIMSVGASGAIYGLIASILILSKAASRPLEGLSDYMIWMVFIGGILFSALSQDVDAFSNIGGFIGGLIISIPIEIYKERQLGGTGDETG